MVALLFAVLYFAFVKGLVGWRSDHTFFLVAVSICLVIHQFTYRLFFILSAFILFWIIYDSMRIYPNYLFNPVHVQEPYDIELWLFGIMDQGKRIIPCEWFITRTNDFLSIVSGISYLMWVPGPVIYTAYLYFKDHDKMVDFSYAFLVSNFVGFIIYYLYPAAPPWYYINFGDATDFTIPGNEGLLSEFDRIINYPLFNGMYAKNANVFAAIPSLHAAYPFVGLLFSIKYKHKAFIGFFTVLTIGIWFAAVYSQHHYIIDLLLGGICAIAAFFIIRYISAKKPYSLFKAQLLKELQ